MYPPPAPRVLSSYRREFGGEAGPYALYGYEAMSVVLDAIRTAGARGNDRQAVIDRFFAIRNRSSVIGQYSMQADGETTLRRYAIDRVQGGRAVFYRALNVP
jgi:branched-chain amino acid transport system substrate-binding protein